MENVSLKKERWSFGRKGFMGRGWWFFEGIKVCGFQEIKVFWGEKSIFLKVFLGVER